MPTQGYPGDREIETVPICTITTPHSHSSFDDPIECAVRDKPVRLNTQVAPFPDELEKLVKVAQHRPGWKIELWEDYERDPGCKGLTLAIITQGYNAYHPEQGETYRVNHFFPVPPATYNKDSWERWLFDRIVDVETHEAGEFFHYLYDKKDSAREMGYRLADGTLVDTMRVNPMAPNHGPGDNPYVVWSYSTDKRKRTSFRGSVNPN